ncbi:MAG: Era-like GTP-binding protein, partial [Pseudanabaena sp.]
MPSEVMPQDDNFLSFDEIFEELNYRQAQRTLRDIVSNLDLSERERRGLEEPLEELQQMLDKLERQVLQIAVFGMVGRGKSSVLNALLGGQVFETGPLHGVTTARQAVEWQISREEMQSNGNRTILKASFQGRGEARIELIDTPGIDEVDGEGRAELAKRIAQQADLILFVVAGDITKVEYDALSELRGASKPILLVFNKIDQYPPEDRMAIYAKIRDERVRELLT